MDFVRLIALMLRKKTNFCKHKSPDCVTNAVQGLLVNVKYGLMIRAAVTLLQLLFKKTKLAKISVTDQLRFPAFLAAFAFISKLVLCLMRRLRGKDDGLNSFVSGFLGGLSVLV
jgi:hypothetical protein